MYCKDCTHSEDCHNKFNDCDGSTLLSFGIYHHDDSLCKNPDSMFFNNMVSDFNSCNKFEKKVD